MQMSDGCVDFNACGFHALAAADSDVAPSLDGEAAADTVQRFPVAVRAQQLLLLPWTVKLLLILLSAAAADDDVAAGRWGSVLPEPNNCSTAKVNWATHATSHTHTQHSTAHHTEPENTNKADSSRLSDMLCIQRSH